MALEIFAASYGGIFCYDAGTLVVELPRGMWDVSSLTRDRTHVPCTGSWIFLKIFVYLSGLSCVTWIFTVACGTFQLRVGSVAPRNVESSFLTRDRTPTP